jgi:hypothetical protein
MAQQLLRSSLDLPGLALLKFTRGADPGEVSAKESCSWVMQLRA